jgi:hypothetical protein
LQLHTKAQGSLSTPLLSYRLPYYSVTDKEKMAMVALMKELAIRVIPAIDSSHSTIPVKRLFTLYTLFTGNNCLHME